MDGLFLRFQQVVADALKISPERITPDARFAVDLDATSLERVMLVAEIEHEFGIEVPNEALMHIETVQDAFDFLEAGLRKKSTPAN